MSVATPWKILKLQSLAGRVSGDDACLSLLEQASCLNFFFSYSLSVGCHTLSEIATHLNGEGGGGGGKQRQGEISNIGTMVCVAKAQNDRSKGSQSIPVPFLIVCYFGSEMASRCAPAVPLCHLRAYLGGKTTRYISV